MLDETILGVAQYILRNQGLLINEYLRELAVLLNVDAIHWHSPAGFVILSSVSDCLGWSPNADHPIRAFQASTEEYVVDEIRQDAKNSELFKYGYYKVSNGSTVQER